MSVTISSHPDLVTGFEDLVTKLDDIQMANAALTEQHECCMANAYLGLNPTSGEPVVSSPADPGKDIEEEPLLDPFGEPLTQGDGSPVVCPAFNSVDGRPKTYIRRVSDFGANVYCVPGYDYAYAEAANPNGPPADFDYIRLNDPDDEAVAVVNDGPYTCTAIAPVDPDLETQLEDVGYFPDIIGCCEAVEPVEPCAELEATNTPSAYYKMWQEYLQCYKRNQRWYLGLYGAQAVLGLINAIESIKLYNKILDKQVDIICEVTNDIKDVRRCSFNQLGDGTEENPGVLKECQDALLEGHIERIGVINNRARWSCHKADCMWDVYSDTYQASEMYYVPLLADKFHRMIGDGQISMERLKEWAQQMEDCVEETVLPRIKEQYAGIMDSVGCTAANLNEWRESVRSKAIALDDHYRTTYQTPEKTMIPCIMDMSTCLTQRVCEMRTWLMECAQSSEDLYNQAYRNREGKVADANLDIATRAVPKICESLEWLERNIPAADHLYQVSYGNQVTALNPRLFQNAQDLAPEIRCCYEFFKNNAIDFRNFWKNCYEDPECAFVNAQVQTATRMLCLTEASINKLDDWAKADRKMYDNNFREVEACTTPDVVYNGNKASNDLLKVHRWWIDREEDFHKTFDTHWQPCDIHNLQQYCELWNCHDPLKQLADNAQCMKELSRDAQDVQCQALEAAQLELEKACQDDERFEYCIEDKATAHVRKVMGQAEQKLLNCSSRYCSGATEEALIRLYSEMVKAEGGAYAAAERWKWWANQSLKDRQFARKQTTINTLAGFAQVAIQASSASAGANESILSRMNEAIVRGSTYLNNSQAAGDKAIAGTSQHLDAMARMIQLWHFWPEMAVSNQQEAHRMTQQLYNDAQNIISIGHTHLDRSSRDKNSAVSLAQNSIDVSLRLIQLGQFHLSQAEQMNQQRAAMAQNAGTLGNATVQNGHNMHRMAGTKMEGAMARSIEGTRSGLQASQIGAGIESTALQQENTTTLNALRHLQAGIQGIAAGRDMTSDVRIAHEAASQLAASSGNSMLNLWQVGHQSSRLAMSQSAACYQQQHEMLCKAKDYVQANTEMFQRSLHGGTSGTLANTNNLLAQQGQNAGSGFSAFGNALDNLIQLNNPTPPLGSGQPLFGGGTGSTGGFGQFGGF